MIDDTFRGPLLFAGVEQTLALFFASMILDTGETMLGVFCASAGYWLGTAIIFFRRRSSPTLGDLVYIRLALIPFVIAGVIYIWWKRDMI